MKFLHLLLFVLLTFTASAQNALKFDGIDDYVQAPQPGPTGSASRTVEAWVKIVTITSSQKVFLDWGDMAYGHRFTFNVINGVPRIEVGGDGINAAAAISTGAWHHIAASYDSASTVMSIYVDGLLSNSGTLTVAVNTSSVNGIIIGRRNDAINNFDGTIDEVRVWNTVRTQGEIAAFINKEFCSTYTGLVAYYKFNEGTAGGNNSGLTTLTDFSGNSNNGTLNTFTLSGTNSNWITGKPLTSNTTSVINPSPCDSNYTSPSGMVYTTAGTYLDTIPNANGCDSVITINLTFSTMDTGVTVTPFSLIAQQSGATYQWVNCATNYSFIAGQTFNVFIPTASGNYAVIITNGSCKDTSACFSFIVSGIDQTTVTGELTVYPNPATGVITVSAPQFANSTLTLFDLMGKELLQLPFNISTKLNISQRSNGFYLLQIKDQQGRRALSTLVKQ